MSSIEIVKRIKEEYIRVLAENPKYIETLEALLTRSEYKPITSFRELNSEGLPDFKNKERQLQELLLDLTAIHSGIVELAERIDDLIYEMDNSVASVLEAAGLEDIEVSGEDSSAASKLYIDQNEKRNFYKDKLVNEYLEKGRLIDKEKLENKLSSEDTKLSVFNDYFIEEGELLDIDKFNSQNRDLTCDLEILYKTLYKILDIRIVNVEEKIRCRLTELNSKAKEYKQRTAIESLGAEGNTIYFSTDCFKQSYENGRVIINLGGVTVPSGSYIACIFKSDEVESDKAFFRFNDDTQIRNYLADKDYLKILGSYNTSTQKMTVAGASVSSFDIGIEAETNSFYHIYPGENKIKVTYDGNGATEYAEKLARVPFRLEKDGLINFYVYNASYIYITSKGKASYKSFEGYGIESPKKRQKIEMRAEAGFEFDIATDGTIYSVLQEGYIKDNKVFCPLGYSDIVDYMVEKIAYGDDVVFDNVQVIVEAEDTTFLDINYIAIKQCSILDFEGESK